jgi:hypothetical protein
MDSAHRHLARRGLWQTAFSYAKALLSLDPEVRHIHVQPRAALLIRLCDFCARMTPTELSCGLTFWPSSLETWIGYKR